MEWKALANAIIHNGFDPDAHVTVMACERCQNPLLHILMESNIGIRGRKYSRARLVVYHCPECGHIELDCTGTYPLPDVMPGTIMKFVGHFMTYWTAIEMRLNQIPRLPKEDD